MRITFDVPRLGRCSDLLRTPLVTGVALDYVQEAVSPVKCHQIPYSTCFLVLNTRSSLRHIQLTQPRLYTPRLLAFHCFLCDHRSCVQRELVGLVVAVATRQAVPCRFVVWRSKARSSVLCWEQPLPFGAPARPAPPSALPLAANRGKGGGCSSLLLVMPRRRRPCRR
jgi:hypothetical protein